VKRRASAKCEEREASICRTEIGIERCSEGRDKSWPAIFLAKSGGNGFSWTQLGHTTLGTRSRRNLK
jgi:hypothetical protein